jgi:hypothetical protein
VSSEEIRHKRKDKIMNTARIWTAETPAQLSANIEELHSMTSDGTLALDTSPATVTWFARCCRRALADSLRLGVNLPQSDVNWLKAEAGDGTAFSLERHGW